MIIRRQTVGACNYMVQKKGEQLVFHEVDIDDSPWCFAKLTFNEIRSVYELNLANKEILKAIKKLDTEGFALLCTFIRAHAAPVNEWKEGIQSLLISGKW